MLQAFDAIFVIPCLVSAMMMGFMTLSADHLQWKCQQTNNI
jgi:hypothetical protein